MKLTLDQVAKELAADLGTTLDTKVSGKQAKQVVSGVFEYLAGALSEGSEISIPGFGKFKVQDKPEREVRNPSTGEMMTTPAKRVFKFTPAKVLKDRIASAGK